ncbi:cysteine dioxygenase [Actinomadura roseirufa]|uniref:cysteine dioxygenase n=1 Tax=Actinomadura roseirufa TaxID=2094049 RepID=UPI001A955749|nr:cysteine dioxygenase [Actinomadura roseirufa]
MVPDLTMRGQDDPHGRAIIARPPTVGQLAARLHDLAVSPRRWWNLVEFDAARPVPLRLDGLDGARVWLTTWPPGHRTTVHDHAEPGVSTLVAGELAEVVITSEGVTERPLRANRIRVHGRRTHAFANPGPAYAISLHGMLTAQGSALS